MNAPQPTGIRAPHGATVFEISWPQLEHPDRLENRLLRGYCPCAGCQGHSGKIEFQPGHNSEIRDIRPVGNYAISLTWGDGHSTGIYTFSYLWRLGRLVEELGTEELIARQSLPRQDESG